MDIRSAVWQRKTARACWQLPAGKGQKRAVPTLLWREAAASFQRKRGWFWTGWKDSSQDLCPLWWLHQNIFAVCDFGHAVVCGANMPGPPSILYNTLYPVIESTFHCPQGLFIKAANASTLNVPVLYLVVHIKCFIGISFLLENTQTWDEMVG